MVFTPKKFLLNHVGILLRCCSQLLLLDRKKKEGFGFYGGKVEMIRCTKKKVAERHSKYHKRGSIYQLDTSINSDMFQKQLTKKIFPAIKKNKSLLDKSERFAHQLKEKKLDLNLPEGCKYADLYLQTDNAPPHCGKSKRLSALIRKAGGRNSLDGVYYGPKVRLYYQPPDSPDLNVMDLGFFTKLWIGVHKYLKDYDHTPTVEDVWEAAQAVWKSIPSLDIEILFRTLDARMKQVIECNGRNEMPIPHGRIRQMAEAEDNELKNMKKSS